MTTLVENEETQVTAGLYAYKVSGALTMQQKFKIFDSVDDFDDISDGVFTEAGSGLVELAEGWVKVVSAGANTLKLTLIRK